MSQLTKRERVTAALRGEPVDRPPVAAWRHFIPEERGAEALAAAHLRFFEVFDWDWLKVNPRATYYAEAWGSRYDYDHYNGVLPRQLRTPVASAADLAAITPRSPSVGVFEEQLDLLYRIKDSIGDAPFVQTVFSPLSVLTFLIAHADDPAGEAGLPVRFERLRSLLHEHPQEVHGALSAIAETLAGYATASVDAGASGIFFAIVRLARAGVLSELEYAAFGRPYDLQVLQAVQGAPFNLLHVCGPQVYFDLVSDYPVQAINWAAIGQDNPTMGQARKRTTKALVGGIDEHGVVQHGTPEQVADAARAAIADAGRGGLLLAPGCGVATDVPAANLHALRAAVESTAALLEA
ncbi:MAG TPA: uroporphyrinogen decarboxylase family protein [Roseiflexaceae bacterium]|nr:uroporphyrinogen decarboxylase family protein [Roseiflexaceae bacterium]